MGLLDPQALEYFGLLGQSMLAGQSPNAGVNVGNAMMYADTEMRRKAAEKARLEEERQQAQIRQLAMDRAKREDDFRKALSGGFQPGTAPQRFNDSLGDGSGGMIPGRAPSMDFSGAMQVDPLAGFQAQKQWQEMNAKAGPQFKEVGGRLVAINPDGTVKEAYAPPEKSKYQEGDTRVIESGRVKHTYEFRKGQWVPIAKSAIDKPEGESKPQFVESMGGFVTPPKGGQSPGFIPVQGAPASKKNAASEAELTAAGYASRMLAADQALSAMPEKAVPGLRQTLANNSYPTLAPYVSSPEQQQYRQSQEDWVRAKLRKESGAVIADEEMAREIRVYFPQPGDSPQVIKQKATARKRANDAMMIAAGKARDQVPAPQGDNSIDSLVSKYLNR